MITLREFFSIRKNRFFWLNIAAMIVVTIGAAWGTLLWLDAYTHHGEAHTVPDVTDKNVAQAQRMLEEQRLKGEVTDSVYVKGALNGIVLEQKPAPGARVKEGRMVYLTVTTTSVPLVRLPDLVDNSSFRQAEAKLKAMGFRLTEPEIVPGEQDWVYGIKYRGDSLTVGDRVPNEALLTLCIGSVALRDSLAADSTFIHPDSLPAVSDRPEVDDSWF